MSGALLGVDLGARSGFAAWLGRDQPVWGSVSFARFAKDADNPDGAVVEAVADWVETLIERYGPIAWLACELPWVPQKGSKRAVRPATAGAPVELRSIADLAGDLKRQDTGWRDPQTVRRLSAVFGRVAGIAHRRKIGWRSPDTWSVERHFVGKSGHKSPQKKALTKAACVALGWTPVNEHEADALALLSWLMASTLPAAAHRQGPLFATAR